MTNKILILVLSCVVTINISFSQKTQKKVKADIETVLFLGRIPYKTEINSQTDFLLRILYYKMQPEGFPKTGYMNINGEILVEPKYNMGSEFYDNYANVINDSIYGYIDKNGKETFFKEYQYAFFYYGDTGIAAKNNKFGLIDRMGNPLTEFKYRQIMNFGFNHFKVQLENKKFQILNNTGELIFNEDMSYDIKSDYFEADSLLVFEEKNQNGDELKGLVNIDGEKIVKAIYESIYFIGDDELIAVKSKQKYGFINKLGEVVVPVKYDKISFNINDNLIPVKRDSKWGYINKKGEEEIPFIFNKATGFTEGLAYVENDSISGYINSRNKIKIEYNFDQTKLPFFSDGRALIKKSDKYGFISKRGKIKVPAIYDKAYPFVDGIAYVELNGKSGYIDRNGKIVIPIKYKQMWFPSNNGVIRFIE